MFGVGIAHFAARVLLCLSFFSLSCLDVPWLLGYALDFFHYSSSLPAGRTPFATSRSGLVILVWARLPLTRRRSHNCLPSLKGSTFSPGNLLLPRQLLLHFFLHEAPKARKRSPMSPESRAGY